MDINCTSDCIHQCDGKCALTEIPESFTSSSYSLGTDYDDTVECLYFESKH